MGAPVGAPPTCCNKHPPTCTSIATQTVGVKDLKVTLQSMERDCGNVVDAVVAAEPLQPGDLAFTLPAEAVVTLDRVFEDETVAELLTDNKLSELACLTLYLMYEKKEGRKSFWFEYVVLALLLWAELTGGDDAGCTIVHFYHTPVCTLVDNCVTWSVCLLWPHPWYPPCPWHASHMPRTRTHRYIKELDRQRGRGQMGAKSPLLWDEGQVETFLAGSPLVQQVAQRIQGIEREYNELDTVWFMAGSLFNKYPYDTPTEAFSLKLFKEAFAAVQSSVVHLQGVPLSKRFALIPLGPPMLAYSSTCKVGSA